MKLDTLVRFTEKDFLVAVVDSRFDTLVTDVTDEEAVLRKINAVFGPGEYSVAGGSVLARGGDGFFKERYSVGDLAHIMNALVDEGGCEWDRAQTHESIRINAVEEAYELADAINSGDLKNLEEETGDLLLQAVFHANIAERAGEFTLDDVVTRLCAKLVYRHTHIFGEDKAATPEEALKRWEDAKAREKHENSLKDKLDRVPKNYPALLRTQKVLKKLFADGLENDAAVTDPAGLAVTIAGALKNGSDLEVDVLRELDAVTEEYVSGTIKKISDHHG